MVSLPIDTIRSIAADHGYQEVQFFPRNRVIAFRSRDGRVRVNVHYTKGTVGICRNKQQHYRYHQDLRSLERLFRNPQFDDEDDERGYNHGFIPSGRPNAAAAAHVHSGHHYHHYGCFGSPSTYYGTGRFDANNQRQQLNATNEHSAVVSGASAVVPAPPVINPPPTTTAVAFHHHHQQQQQQRPVVSWTPMDQELAHEKIRDQRKLLRRQRRTIKFYKYEVAALRRKIREMEQQIGGGAGAHHDVHCQIPAMRRVRPVQAQGGPGVDSGGEDGSGQDASLEQETALMEVRSPQEALNLKFQLAEKQGRVIHLELE